MIKKVQISNFKSIQNLNLDLGRVNVLIGENGCGKTNILEAIAFGCASNANKLDSEFLLNRGIRVTNPEFMASAFTTFEKLIKLKFITEKDEYNFVISNDESNPRKWHDVENEHITSTLLKQLDAIDKDLKVVDKLNIEIEEIKTDHKLIKTIDLNLENQKDKYPELKNAIEEIKSLDGRIELQEQKIKEQFHKLLELKKKGDKLLSKLNDIKNNEHLNNFLIFAPEESILRKLDHLNAIYPIGKNGDGIFQYLKELKFKDRQALDEIRQNLHFLDWFNDFDIPENESINDFNLMIKDKYIENVDTFFDQRSTNEAFLFLLFYFTLLVSKDTPSFFAIDNIESSLNPKLCVELTKKITELSKDHNKQIIVTTHNPSILDGLDLMDDEIRLFVIRRNLDGYTIANRIEYNPERKLSLSEIWTKGYIGGLPDNF